MSNDAPGIEAGLIPHLVCDPCAEAIEFYKKAFGAEECMRLAQPGGDKIMHAAMRIDGSFFFLVDDFPEFCADGKGESPKVLGGSPVTIHRNVKDCDAVIQQAEKAGAAVKMPPQDMFWGDRYGVIVDPFGHNWSLATRIRDVSPEELEAAAAQAMPAQ